MKNDPLIRVPMVISNSVELHKNNPDIPITDPTRRYVTSLVGHTNNLFLYLLLLTILLNPIIQMCVRILLHLMLVDAKEIIIASREAISVEVAHACYASGVTHVFSGPRRRWVRGVWGVYQGYYLHTTVCWGWYEQGQGLSILTPRFLITRHQSSAQVEPVG